MGPQKARERVAVERLAKHICKLLSIRRQTDIERSRLLELLAPTPEDDADVAIAYAVEQMWIEAKSGLHLTDAGMRTVVPQQRREPEKAACVTAKAGWQIIVLSERPGVDDPVVEHFIVAVADRDKAVEMLTKRRMLPGAAKVLVFGEAPEGTIAFLNAKRGEIFAISVVM